MIALLGLKTLLLYALISMAWWEGVDKTHLLIAPGNYLPPSPSLDSVSFTCSIKQTKQAAPDYKRGKVTIGLKQK